jgi:hypothetical protein
VEKLNAADVGRLSPGVSPAKKAKLETAEASSEPTMSLVAILVRSRDHRTQIWKGVTQGPFNQSLVAIGPAVSEEKIKM